MSEKATPKKLLEGAAGITKTIGATAEETKGVAAALAQVANHPETSNSIRGEALMLSQLVTASANFTQAQRNEVMQRAGLFAVRASE